MKRLFTVFGLLCLLACSGCNEGCTIQSEAAGAIATGLSKTLDCSNSAQVLTDVTALIAKTNICSTSQPKPGQKGGVIAAALCPILSQLAASELGNQIPATWQCNPAIAKEGLALALTTACNLIPF